MKDEEWKKLEGLMEKHHVSADVRNYIGDCVKFHTFPAAGLLLGVFMVDLALDKLGAKPGDKLYAVSETGKCLPDAAQVILHTTYGNHRLRVINTGRFSVTINRFAEGNSAPGVRVFVDVEKLKPYPTLYAWYTNDPNYKGGVDGGDLLDDIMAAGRNALSFERVNVRFEPKEKWTSARCSSCGEMVPANTMDKGVCSACGSMAYYDKAD
jgi:formylmethanofuran dehydrogenase subunit E